VRSFNSELNDVLRLPTPEVLLFQEKSKSTKQLHSPIWVHSPKITNYCNSVGFLNKACDEKQHLELEKVAEKKLKLIEKLRDVLKEEQESK
jgi:hypothetical protein